MKLICLLFAVAIMVMSTKGSAMPDSMEDDSDASESEQDLRQLSEIMMNKRNVCFYAIGSYFNEGVH